MDRAIAYAILDISAAATPEEIRAAYRRRAFATHPDRAGGDAAAFHAVCDAYQSLSDPAHLGAGEDGSPSEPGAAHHVPPTDAARVLFEYLSDLASDMILNGATPEMVVSFLAREGCPESVACALERDLRARVQPAPSEPAAATSAEPPASAEPPLGEPPAPTPSPPTPPAAAPPTASPVAPTGARGPARPFRVWVPITAAAIGVCVLGVWWLASRTRSPVKSEVGAPPAAVAVAPVPPSAPVPTRPPRSTPARPSAQQGSPPPVRERHTASSRVPSGEIDAQRDALEADQRRFAAEVAELEAERARIDAADAALASASDVERFASLAQRKAAYNARLEQARRAEKDLQRRVRDLNALITAHNDRVRSGR